MPQDNRVKPTYRYAGVTLYSLRLLKLDERVQEMLIEESISSGHARALLAIKDNELQYNMAMKIFDEKLSVRETEKLIKLSKIFACSIDFLLNEAVTAEEEKTEGLKRPASHPMLGALELELELWLPASAARSPHN